MPALPLGSGLAVQSALASTPTSLIPGLDPGIQLFSRRNASGLDPLVKPGDEGVSDWM